MSCKKTCAGDLRFKIEIIDRSQDPDGCDLNFLTPIKATTRAKIETLETIGANSRLIFDDTNISEAVTHKFTIRFRTDLLGDDIIKFDDRYFKIQGFKDADERKKWLVIYCVERGDVNNTRNQL
jgi:hypothetical protein